MFYNHNVMCVHSIHTCMFASYNNIQGVVCMCAYMLCIYTCMIDICIPGCMHSCIHTTCNECSNKYNIYFYWLQSFIFYSMHSCIHMCMHDECMLSYMHTYSTSGRPTICIHNHRLYNHVILKHIIRYTNIIQSCYIRTYYTSRYKILNQLESLCARYFPKVSFDYSPNL